MTPYAERAFKNNIIYPDHFNEEDLGKRASYFYLHGKLEIEAGYDCFNCNFDLMKTLLRQGIHLATVKMGEVDYKCIVFSSFDRFQKQMKGWVVEIDSLDDVKDAINAYPKCYSPCGGDTPDEYLKYYHPETFMLLYERYMDQLLS